jgi:hypothetical protein
MYSKIVNPVTGRFVKANSLLGKRIINNYIQSAGGSVSRPVPEPEPEHTDDAAEVKAAEAKAKAAYLARRRAYADAEARRLRILAGVKEMVSKGWNSIQARQLLNTTDGNVEKAMANFWSDVALYDYDELTQILGQP